MSIIMMNATRKADRVSFFMTFLTLLQIGYDMYAITAPDSIAETNGLIIKKDKTNIPTNNKIMNTLEYNFGNEGDFAILFYVTQRILII